MTENEMTALANKTRNWAEFNSLTPFSLASLSGHLRTDTLTAGFVMTHMAGEVTRIVEGRKIRYAKKSPSAQILSGSWRTKSDEELGITDDLNDESTGMARATDPETSHAAAQQHTVLGKRAERARQVLELVILSPGSTTGELARQMYTRYPDLPINVSCSTPHKRMKELEKRELVRRGEKRRCFDSNYEAETWYPTALGKQEITHEFSLETPTMAESW